jgi:lysozyme
MIGTDSIIDLSHWNAVSDFGAVKASGVQAIIHKASQGSTEDPLYRARRSVAKQVGLLWGGYHFGTAGIAPESQARKFLMITAGEPVVALDWEWNKADTMTVVQARAFAAAVNEARPDAKKLLYTSAAFLQEMRFGLVPIADEALLKWDLWLAGMTVAPRLPPDWSKWRIWQHGIAACNGVHGQVDRDTFNGTADELTAYFSLP